MTFSSLDTLLDVLPTHLSSHHIILLQGKLASGKTTLVKALAQRIQISQNVTSPTFSIQHIYSSPTHTIFHYDLYQKSLQECLQIGLLEMFDLQGWHFVEWGDKTLEKLVKRSGFAMISISITHNGSNRKYRISQ